MTWKALEKQGRLGVVVEEDPCSFWVPKNERRPPNYDVHLVQLDAGYYTKRLMLRRPRWGGGFMRHAKIWRTWKANSQGQYMRNVAQAKNVLKKWSAE